MTTDKTTRHGVCLMCDNRVLLTPGGTTVRHEVDPSLMGNHAEFAEKFNGQVICLGSGHTGRHDDGHDDSRRFGIRHCATAEAIAARSMAKLEGLDYAAGLDYAGEAVLIHRALATLWRRHVFHGMWAASASDALRLALGESRVAEPLRDAIRHAQALAARQWLREAKWEMARVYADGVPVDDFTLMLFSV